MFSTFFRQTLHFTDKLTDKTRSLSLIEGGNGGNRDVAEDDGRREQEFEVATIAASSNHGHPVDNDQVKTNKNNGSHNNQQHKTSSSKINGVISSHNNEQQKNKNVWNYLLQQQEQQLSAPSPSSTMNNNQRISRDSLSEEEEDDLFNDSNELDENDENLLEQQKNFKEKLSVFESLSKAESAAASSSSANNPPLQVNEGSKRDNKAAKENPPAKDAASSSTSALNGNNNVMIAMKKKDKSSFGIGISLNSRQSNGMTIQQTQQQKLMTNSTPSLSSSELQSNQVQTTSSSNQCLNPNNSTTNANINSNNSSSRAPLMITNDTNHVSISYDVEGPCPPIIVHNVHESMISGSHSKSLPTFPPHLSMSNINQRLVVHDVQGNHNHHQQQQHYQQQMMMNGQRSLSGHHLGPSAHHHHHAYYVNQQQLNGVHHQPAANGQRMIANGFHQQPVVGQQHYFVLNHDHGINGQVVVQEPLYSNQEAAMIAMNGNQHHQHPTIPNYQNQNQLINNPNAQFPPKVCFLFL